MFERGASANQRRRRGWVAPCRPDAGAARAQGRSQLHRVSSGASAPRGTQKRHRSPAAFTSMEAYLEATWQLLYNAFLVVGRSIL